MSRNLPKILNGLIFRVMSRVSLSVKQLGDVVFVELPEAGRQFQQGNDAAVVGVKAASEVYAPVSGELVSRIPN